MGNSLPKRTHLRPSQRVYTKGKIALISASSVTLMAIAFAVYLQFTHYEYAEASLDENPMVLMQPERELPKPFIEKSFVDRYPVTMANFQAFVNPISIELRWKCAAEKDNDHFVVERSINGGSFSELGILESTGCLTKSSLYSFYDNKPGSGILIYRLRQVSHDGNSSFVAIEKVIKNNKNKDKVLYVEDIEPKNFKNYFNINYFSAREGGVSVEIFTKTGKKVFKAYTESKRGYNTCRFIDGNLLTEEEYSLRIANPYGAYVQKLKKNI